MVTKTSPGLLLAPLRGVTIRCFREVFGPAIAEAGFVEAVTPFVSANAGVDPLKDRELRKPSVGMTVTPQFIGKDPFALRDCLQRIRSAGYRTADLNAGCPYPMVRNRGRGSGLLKTPALLEQMIAVGCETMGPGNFSVKTRLGVDDNRELERLMPVFNAYPLRFLVVHARNARQMYDGACDWPAYRRIAEAARIPLVPNGDIGLGELDSSGKRGSSAPYLTGMNPPYLMVGRGFVRSLGEHPDICRLLRGYVAASSEELCGDRPVLGRMKELIAYWRELPQWRRRWQTVKIARTADELLSALPPSGFPADHSAMRDISTTAPFDLRERSAANAIR